MAHGITIRKDGFAEAVYAMKPAWHGLGKVFKKRWLTSGEALEGAGLDWKIVQKPLAIGEIVVDEDGNEVYGDNWEPQAELFANVREDTNLFLGVVSDRYKVVQNTEAFKFLDSLVENHEMRYESAFSLYDGKRVVILAQMPGVDTIVKDDPILRYILMSLGHDGTKAITFGPCACRVVCANTYSVALSEGHTREMTIRHSGRIEDKLHQARDILGIASQKFSQYAEHSKVLAQKNMSKREWRDYLNMMCPELDPRDPDYTDRRAEKIADTRLSITRAYHSERQQTAPKSAWAAYNAVTEHIDHLPRRGADKGRRAEARFNVCLYGIGRDMKERAFRAACQFAGIGA